MAFVICSLLSATAFCTEPAKASEIDKHGFGYFSDQNDVLNISQLDNDRPGSYRQLSTQAVILSSESHPKRLPYLYAIADNPAKTPASVATENNSNHYGDGANPDRLHRYLGYGAVIFGVLAGPTKSNKDLHYATAYTATGLALAACVSGYWEYRDRFDLKKGLFDEDNLHILLGVIGTAGLIYAVASADSGKNDSHGGVGVGGGATIALSIITIKW